MRIQCSCPKCDYNYRVADELAGKSVLCPKCGTRLKVPLEDGDPPTGVSPTIRFSCPTCKAVMQAPPEHAGTTIVCLKCRARMKVPSPITTAAKAQAPASRRPFPVRARTTAEQVPPRASQPSGVAAHSLGIASLVLGVLAFIVSLIPCAGVVGMPVGGLGLLLGIAGLIVALARQGRGIGFPIAGSAVSLLALIIALFWLGVLDSISKPLSDAPQGAQVPSGQVLLPPLSPLKAGKNAPVPDVPVTWDNVGNTGQVGDVLIESPGARSGPVSLDYSGQWRIPDLLVVRLKLTNTSPTKIIKFEGWQWSALLDDENGNKYHLIKFGPGFSGFGDMPWCTDFRDDYNKDCDTSSFIAANLSLHPGKSYVTYLFYEKAAAVSKEARLTLPAKELGGTGALRLRVPILK